MSTQVTPSLHSPVHECLYTHEVKDEKDIFTCKTCNAEKAYLVSGRVTTVETIDERCQELDKVISKFLDRYPDENAKIFTNIKPGKFDSVSSEAFMAISNNLTRAFATLTPTQAHILKQQIEEQGFLTTGFSMELIRRERNPKQPPLFDSKITQRFIYEFKLRISNDNPQLMRKLLVGFHNVPNSEVKQLATTMIERLESEL
ncbi:hypothetical protein D5018_10585 [Parashewanella curva]|uniref:Uncharacterized protein n=1 Tax=Parashewanella curva TaxID=2338552 RepID=A0A3L8PWK9_9GAMM|nr:hypothetical protein [Parashewanella curva]RLV59700.1 hypothetical protein D5018_10585 [Parashewanella curva]